MIGLICHCCVFCVVSAVLNLLLVLFIICGIIGFPEIFNKAMFEVTAVYILAKTKYDVDMSMLVDALMEDELYDDQMNAKFTDLKDLLYSDAVKFMNVTMKSNPNSSTVHWGISGSVFSR